MAGWLPPSREPRTGLGSGRCSRETDISGLRMCPDSGATLSVALTTLSVVEAAGIEPASRPAVWFSAFKEFSQGLLSPRAPDRSVETIHPRTVNRAELALFRFSSPHFLRHFCGLSPYAWKRFSSRFFLFSEETTRCGWHLRLTAGTARLFGGPSPRIAGAVTRKHCTPASEPPAGNRASGCGWLGLSQPYESGLLITVYIRPIG